MIIKSSFKQYKVVFEKNYGFLKNFFEGKETFFVIDRKVFELYRDNIFNGLAFEKIFLIDAQEQKKNIQTVLDICETMTKLDAKRNIHLISVGGGIIQDITGLAANILYRGIRWTFVPTTLLAACDSCIGGKTSLNYKSFKNLLGTFYPPDCIYIYPDVLQTLTENDFKSGLGEVIKFNIMYGTEGIRRIEENITALLARDEKVVGEFIKTSLEFKKKFIEEDEFDRGIRIHLNFAHTFGHAIESVTRYAVPHGTAVAMGMIIADYISYQRRELDKKTIERIEKLLLQIIPSEYDISTIAIRDIIQAIRKDKKQTDAGLKAVLFDKNMKLTICADIKEEEITDALKHLKTLLG